MTKPDPTPDLDAIERLAEHAIQSGGDEGRIGVGVSVSAVRWLLRAARERDEWRDSCLRAQSESHAWHEMMTELRARAEKAEARAKELEALLSELLPSTKPCVCVRGVVAPELCAWCRARAMVP